MLIKNQIIKAKWGYKNKKYYEDKGYVFTKYGDEFEVKFEDLNPNSNVKVWFICDVCGSKHYVTNKNHNKYNKENHEDYICIDCYRKNIALYSLDKRRNYIYENILKQCQKYGYELLTKKEEIINVDSMIYYVCPKHGKQRRRCHLFLYGDHICPECNKENKKLPVNEVINKIRAIGSDLLNPEDYQGSQISNLIVICPSCGETFTTSYNSMICTRSKESQLCPDCTKTISAGENKIKKFLDDNNIDYELQKRFDDCKDSHTLPFDFYLPIKNTAIEYDGEQHFMPVAFSGDIINAERSFELVKKHDKIKNKYCKDHQINLLRIPFSQYKEIDNILTDQLLT